MSELQRTEPSTNAAARPTVKALALRTRHGDYGIDAPAAGPIPLTALGALMGGLALVHRRGRPRLAAFELVFSLVSFFTLAVYLHTTRRGKFEVWADVLEELSLRGDEQVLDMGCGRGAVMGMVAKLVPHGHVVGLDLWTLDQSENHPDATQRNMAAEGVDDRCELKTGDMLSMPFPDDSFDLVVSSIAIHNVDGHNIRDHRGRLHALDEAVRVLKPGGQLVIADFFSGTYARHMRGRGLENVQQRSLGWRFWYLPAVGAGLVTATKPSGFGTE